jgi:hypothetical protein
VQCDVDVVSWRERRVLASVAVAADVDTLWQVITDYERLADFIPNLVHRYAFLTSRSRCCWLPLANFGARIAFNKTCSRCDPIVFAVGGFRARTKDGYGWSRGGCSRLCTGTSRRVLCWTSRRSPIRYVPLSLQSTSYNCLLAIN